MVGEAVDEGDGARGVGEDGVPSAVGGLVRPLPRRVQRHAHEPLATGERHVRGHESALAADRELSIARLGNRLGVDPLHLDPIREPHHCRSPWAQASGVRTGRVPRCGIHRDTPRDLRRWFCGLLQQCDVGICLEQPLPAFRAAGDVPGDDLHGARTGHGKNGSVAASAPRG